MSESSDRALLGIFVGGKARRMGGVQKALLDAPGGAETLLQRTLRVGREAGLEPVLVGQAELGPVAEGVVQLPDLQPGSGPLAGLAALLAHARARPALAVACDMPYVTAALLRRLRAESPGAVVLAPRDAQAGKWQPLFARYDAAHVSSVLARSIQLGTRSFQALFQELPVRELALSDAEWLALRDWDTPEDTRGDT